MNGDLNGSIRQALGLPRDVFDEGQEDGLRANIVRGWRDQSACVDCGPEVWFPERGTKTPGMLQSVCVGCPVRRSCLASAILVGELGVWAGTSCQAREAATSMVTAGLDVNEVLDNMLSAAEPTSSRPAAASLLRGGDESWWAA